jgi:hypothetical protein
VIAPPQRGLDQRVTVRVVETEVPLKLAVIVVVFVRLTGLVETTKEAIVEPPGTVTVARSSAGRRQCSAVLIVVVGSVA